MTNLSKFAALAVIALSASSAQAEAEAEETPLYEYLIPVCPGHYYTSDPENDSLSILVSTDGTAIARLKGNEVRSLGDGCFVTEYYHEDKQGNKPSYIYDAKGHLLASYNGSIYPLGQNRFGLLDHNIHGESLMDIDGKLIVPATPNRLYYPGANGVLIYNHNTREENSDFLIEGYYGLCTLDGKYITPPIYQRIAAPQDGLFPMARNNKSGFLDSLGNEVLAPIYDYDETWGADGEDFMEIYHADGKFLVPRDGKYGLIDSNGKTIIPFEYTGGNIGSKGSVLLFNDSTNSVFNLSGRKLRDSFPTTWGDPDADLFPGSRLKGEYWKFGFFDKSGKEAIPCIYDEVVDFYDGKALVRRGQMWDVIDTKGNVLVKALARFIELH